MHCLPCVDDDRVGGADVESAVDLATDVDGGVDGSLDAAAGNLTGVGALDVDGGVDGSLVISDAAAGNLTDVGTLDVGRGVDGSLVVSDAAAGNLMGVGALAVDLAGRVFDASSMARLEIWIVDMLDTEERDVDTVPALVWAS
ncbi:hypothetical protein HBH70_227920 [Parastagonospora nodorum]|nr:hypothetical protein HBH52_239190 [Parastagonospora nodorum]KAH3987047.1 hypothetical protein HBH51_015710 [Parastagonospora nodorum]KAH4072941.1 hypothetical protein HBH50_047250 [Parastagonospora nodorum]KAH4100005.1 hypothetical protein HBH48_014780 [Parastagonospora nodorum]KAH4109089.1 hypothetical protein HBH46_032880 [Parastagonospora nodorum]